MCAWPDQATAKEPCDTRKTILLRPSFAQSVPVSSDVWNGKPFSVSTPLIRWSQLLPGLLSHALAWGVVTAAIFPKTPQYPNLVWVNPSHLGFGGIYTEEDVPRIQVLIRIIQCVWWLTDFEHIKSSSPQHIYYFREAPMKSTKLQAGQWLNMHPGQASNL